MTYTVQNIGKIIQGELQGDVSKKIEITHLLYDSRLLAQPHSTLFFALKSFRNDGHKYIPALYQKGVRAFVISNEIDEKSFPKAAFIKVQNALDALQFLAKFHREHFDYPVISITGSNGKTIVKEWLYQLLEQDVDVVRSPKSYNSQIGVPVSVWQMSEQHQLAIIEAGISKKNEMTNLEAIIQPTIGVFTNIGDAHNDGFQSLKEKVEEKAILFKNAQIVIYCKDYELIHQTLSKLQNKHPQLQLFSWSKSANATFSHISTNKTAEHTTITGFFQKKILNITIPFTDDASIENAIHCWALALFLKKSPEQLTHRFARLTPVALRLELAAAANNCTMINDSYSADLNSLTIALNFLQQQTIHKKQTVILSDFLHQNSTNIYKEIADLLLQKGVHRLIAIGQEIKIISHSLKKEQIELEQYHSTDDFLKKMQSTDFQNETILIKGARKFRFEKIANRLAQKIHQTTLEINLNALIHNLNVYRNLLKPTTKIMVMVKASAYGSGSHEVAKLLEFNRIDYLAVAYTDEGVELRKSGVKLPILVLNPEPASFEMMIRYRLEPEIYSFKLLRIFEDFVRTFDFPTAYPIHIKVNTGMNRLGFEPEEAEQLAQDLSQSYLLKVASIFSHLAGSDAAQFDDFTRQQIKIYQDFYKKITPQLGYTPIRHILNSGGIVRFSEHQMDMVRLGIGLYGIDSSTILQNQLETVSTLKASISQIKDIAPHETVGYNRSGTTDKPIRSATVSIGYADGLMRHAGNGRVKLLVRGVLAPIIGNVCMDMCMLDVTHIREVQEGDEVIIFGKTQDIREVAQQLGTIPYEIFTNISPRVKRVYFQE